MSWETINILLFSLDKVVFITYFVMLSLAMLVERKVSSFVITLVVLTLANGAMTSISPVLYQHASQPGLFSKFVWYASYTAIDAAAIFLLFKFHELLKQNVGFVANLLGAVFLVFASLQTARFIDRFVVETETLQILYQYAIPLINVLIVPVIIFAWFSEFRLRHVHDKSEALI